MSDSDDERDGDVSMTDAANGPECEDSDDPLQQRLDTAAAAAAAAGGDAKQAKAGAAALPDGLFVA